MRIWPNIKDKYPGYHQEQRSRQISRARTQENAKSEETGNAKKVLGDSKKEKQANTKEDLPQSQAALEKRWSQAKMKRNIVVLKPRSRVALRRMSLGDTEGES